MPLGSNSHPPAQEDQQTQSVDKTQHTPLSERFRRALGSKSRRSFLTNAGLFTIASAATGVLSPSLSSKKFGGDAAQAISIGPLDDQRLNDRAYRIRVRAAQATIQGNPVLDHPTNGDEERYPNKIATDTRGLPHNNRGEVNLEAYNSLIRALRSGRFEDFENIILGQGRRLVNPLGPLAVSLEGGSPPQFAIPAAPRLNSARQASEIVELYWQALLRDVPFSEFQNNTSNELVLAAVQDLNKLSDVRGPKQNGQVTPQTLFRGSVLYTSAQEAGASRTVPGVTIGPYISQFLLRSTPFGYQALSPLIRTAASTRANDFLIDYNEWLLVQNGGASGKSIQFDSTQRYVYNGRDLAEVARNGGNLFFQAALILQAARGNTAFGGLNAPLDPGNPYVNSRTQLGSAATFAGAYINGLLLRATTIAIRTSYWEKFYVHRRLRPEAFAGLVYNNLVNKTQYPINEEVFNSQALARTLSTYNTSLLSHAYPEGAPFHSSYPGGASAIAGAHATLLKAFYDENFVIPDPVTVDPNNPQNLIPYTDEPLTLGGELNKLAANYSIGRNWAGIHWRTDAAASLALGEAVAISILKDEKLTFRERFNGYTLTKFDGQTVTI